MAALVRLALGGLIMFIGALKFLHAWESSIPQALDLFSLTIGTQNDWSAEVFLRGFSALQFIAGFFIVINQCKTGAQIFFVTILAFLATTYNPYLVGVSYENITLAVNEASLIGLCWILYGYANAQEPQKCPFAHKAMQGDTKGEKEKVD